MGPECLLTLTILLQCCLLGSGEHYLTSFAKLGTDLVSQSPDPSCRNVSRAVAKDVPPVVPSDNFYKEVTKDRVHIVATEVDLSPDSPLYDPCKDFYLETVTLRIKGHLRWKASNIYIIAVNVTVVGKKAVLDVSYQTPGPPTYSPGQTAPAGAKYGDPGQTGHAGGHGGHAGNATLYLGVVHNGTLEVLAQGGPGGRGQDGGDGHEGEPGKPQTDHNACCHHHNSQGHPGGKGGDGGRAGKSGDGGDGGVITVYTLRGSLKNSSSNSMSNITIPMVTGSVQGGVQGPPAKPGKPMPGGVGGMGSASKCKKHTFGGHSCHGPPGPSGAHGAPGNPAPSTPPGTPGQAGELNLYEFSDMKMIGDHVSTEFIQITMREANKRYRNSDFTGALHMYVWIDSALKNSTDPQRRGYAHKARVMLIQMSKGLDYWAHSLNNMPMNSYNSIFKYLNDYVLPYLKDVEMEYRIYFSAEESDDKKMEIVRNTINHNKFTMTVNEKNKQDDIKELQKAQSELEHLIHQQVLAQQQAEGMTALCQNAIQNEIQKEKSHIGFQKIFKIAIAVVKIYGAIYDGGLTLASGVEDLQDAITAFNNLDGSFIKNLFDLDEIKTIVKNFELDKVFDNITNSWDEIVRNYDAIEQTLEKKGQENSAKILSDGTVFDKQYDKWLYLSQCSEARRKFQYFLNISQSVNDKIMHHDAIAVKIATIDAEAKILEAENAELQSKITNIFDPNLIAYSIAVGRVLYSLKDAFVDQMKRLHESYIYQFLEHRAFAYDDSSVAMFEAWMATNTFNRLQRMEQIGNQVEKFNVNAKPFENSIVLKRTDFPDAFDSLDKHGNMSFVLTGAEEQLSSMTHAHMTAVRVWLDGVRVNSDHVQVWIKRYGTSQVYDQKGNPWTFTHGARTMLFDYSTIDHSRITPHTKTSKYKENTQVQIDEDNSDYVALSPIGPWSISVSKRYNPGLDTSQVKAVYLQLSYSFLPCAQPECPLRSVNVTSNSGSNAEKNLTPAKEVSLTHESNAGTIAAVCCAIVVVAIVIALIVIRVKKDRLYRYAGRAGSQSYDSI